jgi:glycosyltransferase involved in cell wall biosynthesis
MMVTLSIVIPVYNEVDTLEKILEKVESVDFSTLNKGKINREIILVDDCSTDGTRDLLKKLENKYRVLYHTKNGGKGRALRTGLKFAKGDIIVIQDADMEYDPEDHKKLIVPILENKTKVVYGSRFLGEVTHDEEWAVPSHYLGNKLLSIITSALFFRKITDMETCYKMFRKEVLKKIPRLKATRFDFEPEITAKIIKAGYDIIELPIHYHPRDFSEGKKINWKDGVKALYYLFYFRFFN